MGDVIDSTFMHINDLPKPIPIPTHQNGVKRPYYTTNRLLPSVPRSVGHSILGSLNNDAADDNDNDEM